MADLKAHLSEYLAKVRAGDEVSAMSAFDQAANSGSKQPPTTEVSR